MKKKILFIEESLDIGGAEKSLLTILSLLDYSKYDVDLFLFKHEGAFMSLLPKEVNLLPKDKNFNLYNKNRKLSFLTFAKVLDFKRAFWSVKYLVKCLFTNKILRKEYIGWEEISHFFDEIPKEYDVAIFTII